MRHCEACNTDIINNNCIKCTRCIKQYQKLCISFSDEDLQNEKTLNNWLCPHCRSKQPKGNNSNTPIRPSTPRSTAEITFNVTRRKGKQARSDPYTTILYYYYLVLHNVKNSPNLLINIILKGYMTTFV